MCYPAGSRQILLGNKGLYGPLALAYLINHTPKHYEFQMYDEWIGMQMDPYTIKADLVAISAISSAIPRAYEISDVLKKRGIKCVIGGPHVSALPDEALNHFDSIITGEGENPWVDYLQDFESGKTSDIYQGTMNMSLTNLGIPARKFIRPEYHLDTINTSRGCPHNCSFCYLSLFDKRTYRTIPHDFILDDLSQISKEKRVVAITDENFIGGTDEHLEDRKVLLEKIIRSKFRLLWGCQTTVKIAEHPDVLNLMYKAGCRVIYTGFETSSNDSLLEVNKKHNIKCNYKEITRTIQKHKIAVIASYVIGLDSHNNDYHHFLKKEIIDTNPDFIRISYLSPWPGTPMYKKLHRENRIDSDYANYDFDNPYIEFKNYSRKEIIEARNKIFKSFYRFSNISKILIRNLFRINIHFLILLINLITRWKPAWVSKKAIEIRF